MDNKNIYLLSFNLGIGDEYPICYELVYADSLENAKDKLKEKYNKGSCDKFCTNCFCQRVYDIENCTIM